MRRKTETCPTAEAIYKSPPKRRTRAPEPVEVNSDEEWQPMRTKGSLRKKVNSSRTSTDDSLSEPDIPLQPSRRRSSMRTKELHESPHVELDDEDEISDDAEDELEIIAVKRPRRSTGTAKRMLQSDDDDSHSDGEYVP